MSVRTILVGVDESEGSRVARDWAAELAADLGARLVLVHAFEPLAHLDELRPGVDLRAARDRATEALRGPFSADLRARGLDPEVLVVEGQPLQVLVDAAERVEADLIVVAARRRGRLEGLLLGSTSSRLPQNTARPVVVIHAETAGTT